MALLLPRAPQTLNISDRKAQHLPLSVWGTVGGYRNLAVTSRASTLVLVWPRVFPFHLWHLKKVVLHQRGGIQKMLHKGKFLLSHCTCRIGFLLLTHKVNHSHTSAKSQQDTSIAPQVFYFKWINNLQARHFPDHAEKS